MLSDLGRDYNSDFVIDPSEVDIRLSKIKIYKAPGPDGIPNWLLRDFSQLHVLCHPLGAIFNASIREGSFSPVWKLADVMAIPKVHPPTSIQNDLRPIPLLPTAGKVLKGIVKHWLMIQSWIKTSLANTCQEGFCSCRIHRLQKGIRHCQSYYSSQ